MNFIDDFFAAYYAHLPVNATFIGQHDFDHLLPDFSESGLGDALSSGRELLGRADAEKGQGGGGGGGGSGGGPGGGSGGSGGGTRGGGLTPDAIDRRLVAGFLKIQEWELGSEHFQRGNPSLHTGEAIFGLLGLFLSDFAPIEQRVAAATERMRAIPAFLRVARDMVRSAPATWTERAIRECDGAAAFLSDGVACLEVTHRLDAPAFRTAAAGALRAFVEHRAHLESELLGRTHDRYACGAEAFDLYVKHGHFLRESADDVVRHAEEAMAEGEAYAREHAKDFDAASPAEALAGLADVHPPEDRYYDRYREVWDEVRRIADERALLTWPDFPIRYVPRPEWAVGAAPHLYFLFYRSPAAFGRPEVHDYLVAPLPADDREAFLRANNDSVIKLNHVVHHGGLGHHVQNWHAFRGESRIGRVAAVDCASRIAMFCGGTMAEGWACYATDLAAEAGALTPLERYAEAHGRVRMAARAIVDVRLHRGELTLEEAADFYQARAGMSAAAARGEAVKNSMFPGAALMYLMGTDQIHALRSEMERRAGSAFDLRSFHDAFLSHGSIPVALIAEAMMEKTDGE